MFENEKEIRKLTKQLLKENNFLPLYTDKNKQGFSIKVLGETFNTDGRDKGFHEFLQTKEIAKEVEELFYNLPDWFKEKTKEWNFKVKTLEQKHFYFPHSIYLNIRLYVTKR